MVTLVGNFFIIVGKGSGARLYRQYSSKGIFTGRLIKMPVQAKVCAACLRANRSIVRNCLFDHVTTFSGKQQNQHCPGVMNHAPTRTKYTFPLKYQGTSLPDKEWGQQAQ